MLINQLLELYNGFLTAVIMCYIIYRLNADLKRASALNYLLSSLVITLSVFLIDFMFPDMIRAVMLMSDILIVTFVIRVLHKFSIYYSVLTAVFGTILIGFADAFVALTYAFPLKLTSQEFRTHFIHISIGSALMFLFIYILLKFIANNFIKVRKRIHKKYSNFTVLLSVNLASVFAILLFVYSIFGYYMDYQAISNRGDTAYYSLLIIIIVLIISIVGTLYLINCFIFYSLKYDKLKMIHVMDTMTDTLNRGSGLRFIENQIEICKKSKKTLIICYIDINDLKVINDKLGHREGDQLIKAIVRTIKENIRGTDVISRLGGDEFVIAFPGCTIEYGEKVMKRISEKLKHLSLFKSEEYIISISYGFSEYGGNCEITVEGLLDQADHQMYLNKRAIKAII